MIKLLIVDDEEEIRSGIRNIIDWKSNGVQICGEAGNGKEAMEEIEKQHPDILLVDIRMPVMSGLQVIEGLKLLNYSIKSIILSGYDDFSYAQAALKNGASDYLLKPCRPEEILKTVLNVKASIESDNAKNEMISRLKIQFNQSLPLLKEKFLNKFLTSGKKSEDGLKENFNSYKINLDCTNSTVIIIRIDDYFSFCSGRSSEDIELMKFAIKNITSEILSEKYTHEVFENYEDIAAIVNCNDDLTDILESIKDNISNFLGFTVSIGVGSNYEDLAGISLSYNEAVKSIEAKFLIGSDTIIRYNDLHDRESSDQLYPVAEEKEIINSVRVGRSEDVEGLIDGFFSSLESNHASKDYIVKCSMALALSLYHLCIEKNIEINAVFGQGFLFFDQLQKLDTLAQLKVKVNEIVIKTQELLYNKKSSNKLIEAAIKFIEENYNKDLNLESVARKVYITPGYLSLLFKQILGINYVDFLHKTRIEKACAMLKNVRLKTYEVASRVGYADEKYFSQIFKKYIGMTPAQYRES